MLSLYRKHKMEELSLKYSGKSFWHSIGVMELGNSLLWFWWYLQLLAKEKNIDDLQINVKATKKWSFVVMLDLVAQNAWLFWKTIDIIGSLLDLAKTIIELKKHLKGKQANKTHPDWNGNITIENSEWNSITISNNVYNIYNNNISGINNTLWWFASPLQKIEWLTDISILSNKKDGDMLVNINKEEWWYFSNDWMIKTIEKDSLVEWTIKSMSMNNFFWTMEVLKKNCKISFREIRLNNDYIHCLTNSMADNTKIYIKWDITFEWDDIVMIDIKEVISQNLL